MEITPEQFTEAVEACLANQVEWLKRQILRPDDRQAIEDIAAEGIMNAWRRRTYVKNDRCLAGYIYQCVRNILRSSKRRKLLPLRMLDITAIANEEMPLYLEEPQDLVIAADLLDNLKATVTGLPQYLQDTIKLVYYDGLPIRQAADVLGVPVNTVKRRLNTARNKLRKMLGIWK